MVFCRADRVVIRDGGYGCCGDPERDPVLLVLTNPQEIADFRALFKFEEKGANSVCMCCGHPGIDWWKGDVLVARTAVQHLQGTTSKTGNRRFLLFRKAGNVVYYMRWY